MNAPPSTSAYAQLVKRARTPDKKLLYAAWKELELGQRHELGADEALELCLNLLSGSHFLGPGGPEPRSATRRWRGELLMYVILEQVVEVHHIPWAPSLTEHEQRKRQQQACELVIARCLKLPPGQRSLLIWPWNGAERILPWPAMLSSEIMLPIEKASNRAGQKSESRKSRAATESTSSESTSSESTSSESGKATPQRKAQSTGSKKAATKKSPINSAPAPIKNKRKAKAAQGPEPLLDSPAASADHQVKALTKQAEAQKEKAAPRRKSGKKKE